MVAFIVCICEVPSLTSISCGAMARVYPMATPPATHASTVDDERNDILSNLDGGIDNESFLARGLGPHFHFQPQVSTLLIHYNEHSSVTTSKQQGSSAVRDNFQAVLHCSSSHITVSIAMQASRATMMQRNAMPLAAAAPRRVSVAPSPRRADLVIAEAARLEFIRGIDEPTVPEVRLSRSRTGASGAAMFIFENPSIFEASGDLGDITGLFMEDDEGTLTTTDVKAKFVNGKPQAIEARYMMKSGFEWDRFMRFMDRYAEEKGLGFEKGGK